MDIENVPAPIRRKLRRFFRSLDFDAGVVIGVRRGADADDYSVHVVDVSDLELVHATGTLVRFMEARGDGE